MGEEGIMAAETDGFLSGWKLKTDGIILPEERLPIGLVVALAGHRWVEKLMPPVVTGAVVAVIGLNLAPIAVKGVSGQPFDTAIGLITVLAVGLVAVVPQGLARRVPILLGGLIA